MRPPVVVKIGGSLVTHRDGAAAKRLDEDALERIANELMGFHEPLVVVHGAGSFGHQVAREHGLADPGAERTAARLDAFVQVHEDVAELNRAVVAALQRHGFRSVPLRPIEFAHFHDAHLDRFDVEAFVRALTFGLTPVTYGDAVRDDVLQWHILGGDVIAARLAGELGAPLLVHATDVDGVYDRAPSQPGARLLATLTADEADALAREAGPRAGRADVTGGMAGKLAASAAAARRGTDVFIMNGAVPGRLEEALAGRDVPGTWIRAPKGVP